MADVPAATDGANTTGRSISSDRMRAMRARRNAMNPGLMQMAWVRQLGLMVGLAAAISGGVMLALWAQDPDYKPLYSNLEVTEASAVARVLETAGIRFSVEPDSGLVLVPAGEMHAARMRVAAADVLGNRTEGYMLLDQEQELGTSQFMENARYQRAIEGELARTIASLKNVRSARVMLAIPKQSVFVRDERKPSASVFVEMLGGYDLEPHQVKAVMQLVANSVPQMSKQDVSIVDQHGNLRSELGDDSGFGETQKQFEFAQQIEQELRQKISNLLMPVVGSTRFNAQVAADVDFTAVEEAEEMFNPDLPSVRSEETLEETRNGGAPAAGIPGALTNQPPADGQVPQVAGGGGAAAGGGSASNQRRQSTRNYELDRTISYTRHQVGKVTRLTVAIVLDDVTRVDPATGEVSRQEWTPEALARMEQLVKDTIGFNTLRGDRVSVVNESFAVVEVEEVVPQEFWTQDWFIDLVKQGLVALLVIFLTFVVLRPLLNMLGGPKAHQQMREMLAEQELERMAEEELEAEERGMNQTVTLSGGGQQLLNGPRDGYGQQLNAIKDLVDENPARVAQVVKGWVASEG